MDSITEPRKKGRPKGNAKEEQNIKRLMDLGAKDRVTIMSLLNVGYNRAGVYLKKIRERTKDITGSNPSPSPMPEAPKNDAPTI